MRDRPLRRLSLRMSARSEGVAKWRGPFRPRSASARRVTMRSVRDAARHQHVRSLVTQHDEDGFQRDAVSPRRPTRRYNFPVEQGGGRARARTLPEPAGAIDSVALMPSPSASASGKTAPQMCASPDRRPGSSRRTALRGGSVSGVRVVAPSRARRTKRFGTTAASLFAAPAASRVVRLRRPAQLDQRRRDDAVRDRRAAPRSRARWPPVRRRAGRAGLRPRFLGRRMLAVEAGLRGPASWRAGRRRASRRLRSARPPRARACNSASACSFCSRRSVSSRRASGSPTLHGASDIDKLRRHLAGDAKALVGLDPRRWSP